MLRFTYVGPCKFSRLDTGEMKLGALHDPPTILKSLLAEGAVVAMKSQPQGLPDIPAEQCFHSSPNYTIRHVI